MSESLQSVIAAISLPLDVYSSAQRDERYLDLRAELDKLSSPAGGDVDWQRVLDLGASLLGEVGKDLLVCAYTMSGLYELHGIAGVAFGIGALAGLMRGQTAHLGPRKAGSRANALRWFLDRLKVALERTLEASEGPALVYLKERLGELRGASVEHLGERSPAFGPLLEVIESQLMTLPAEALSKPFDNPLATAVEGVEPEPTPEPEADAASGQVSREPEDNVQARAAWMVPIEGPDGCGEAPRKYDEYSLIRTELQKGDAVVEGVEVDWRRVRELADGLLREKSKDLQVACWFAISSFYCRGFDGLTLGLGVVAGLVRAFPEIHPRRARARRNSAGWLVSEVTRVLAAADIKELSPRLESLRVVSTELTDALRERLGDDAPAARPLREIFSQIDADLSALADKDPAHAEQGQEPAIDAASDERRRDETSASPEGSSASGSSSQLSSELESGSVAVAESVVPPVPLADASVSVSDSMPAPAPTPVSPPAPNPASTSAPAADVAVASVIAEPANLVEVEQFLTATGRTLVSTASSLRSSTPVEPRSYRLLRAGLWLHLRVPPATRADGNTGLPSLDERSHQQLVKFVAAGQWKALLHRSENLLINHRLVLDLNRFTAEALRNLGSDYDAARLEVRTEVRALLTRLPSLLELRARDGSPLADPATKRWISKEVLPRAKAAVLAGSVGGLGSDDAGDAEFWSSLSQRLQSEEQSDALSEVRSKIGAAASGQLRFVLSLRLAEAMAEAAKLELAEALFTGLVRDAETLGLASWQPELAARCLGGLVRARHDRGRSYWQPLSGLVQLDPGGAAGLLDELGA